MSTTLMSIVNTAWTAVTGSETRSVTSITLALDLAIVTTPVPHEQINGATVTISGADQTEYNGVFIISVLSPTAFTYVVTAIPLPVSPATGTINVTAVVTVVGPRDTVNLWALEREIFYSIGPTAPPTVAERHAPLSAKDGVGINLSIGDQIFVRVDAGIAALVVVVVSTT